MRLIDADYLKNLPFEKMIHTDWGDTAVPIEEIDNAPTVEITEEQAIDKLHETGWLPRHDKEMTERPQGEWINSQVGQTCNLCKEIQFGYDSFRNFCPNCGARMKGGTE